MYTHIFFIHIYIHPWLSVCFYATYPPLTGNQNPTMGWYAMVGGLLQVTQTQVQKTNELRAIQILYIANQKTHADLIGVCLNV